MSNYEFEDKSTVINKAIVQKLSSAKKYKKLATGWPLPNQTESCCSLNTCLPEGKIKVTPLLIKHCKMVFSGQYSKCPEIDIFQN